MSSAKLVECLRQLQRSEYGSDEASRRSSLTAERALEAVWQAGRRGALPASDRSAQELLLSSAAYIRAHIERVACQFRMRLENSVLRKRSAIQFLIDDFGLAGEFSESAEIFDQVIYSLKDVEVSDSDGPLPEPDHSGVPAHHTWWTQ